MDLFTPEKPRVLTIDTPFLNSRQVQPQLQDLCELVFSEASAALIQDARDSQAIDLIVLDNNMHDKKGHEICRLLKQDPLTWNIPVILFGDSRSDGGELKALESGAIDFITLPTSPDIFLARVKTQLSHHSAIDLVRKINAALEDAVALRTEEIAAAQDATVLAMTALAQTRDSETGLHIQRTQHYIETLCFKLQQHPRFAKYLTNQKIRVLFKSAPLHDIGKIGIPDRILLKPGKFEPAEMEIMKSHTTLGRDAIEYAEKLLGKELEFLTTAKEIAYSHQEKWDGSGYPQGLSGEAIPISARLMAVADVYDAIISRRVYKEGMPHAKAVSIISAGKGKHFDPDIVDAFLSVSDQFEAIAARFADSDEDMQLKAAYMTMAAEDARG